MTALNIFPVSITGRLPADTASFLMCPTGLRTIVVVVAEKMICSVDFRPILLRPDKTQSSLLRRSTGRDHGM